MKRSARKGVQWQRDEVHALRQHLGMTQREMAEELGIRQQTISDWETGAYRPRGASATLLSMVAERAGFPYQAGDAPTTPTTEKQPS
ncbi:MAG: helix-turn-helix domain-containing protein [Chloroflexi bacterium]|nr:helix-turn-helix domain-containing protein [Chloroflexota bacterium]